MIPLKELKASTAQMGVTVYKATVARSSSQIQFLWESSHIKSRLVYKKACGSI